ncbi:tRNA (cytosine(38)-C(5))-methyltransferase [Condylostylus longicornis]|uniref:tRNA (cytosine(38)-C(5))-methyltransferase n=1 Tax=Condylostylus longicornis TaxID=2530218 RepID=UPI00244E52FC|nr:tRNA (cytosine(38)-C(5))-methyltransferase [Condylostylus longicornis]
MPEHLNILELFSGIGGMHAALKRSGASGEIKGAVDINPIANSVYIHNYPNTKVFNKNIQSCDSKFIEKLQVNTILMSPPCQPFTRVGNQRDVSDNRTDALKYICSTLPKLTSIEFILMENVKGFENSEARNLYVKSLKESNFRYREFILSPSQFGIPNTRHRYFCIARKNDFNFEDILWESLPNKKLPLCQPFSMKKILEPEDEIPKSLYLSEDLLQKRLMLLDIVNENSTNSICFTKAYTHYAEGTGSVLSKLSKNEMSNIFNEINSIDKNSPEYLELLKSLKLRYFMPQELLRIMCFPEEFQFPSITTQKQKYRLIGNSVNVFVVSELINLLIS